MPDCRKPLVVSSGDGPLGKLVVVGEMAHIVGEKNTTGSPRGISPLSADDRNKYSNLILLCEEHHTIIDTDIATWPIERLHMIKSDHELWIEQRLDEIVDENLAIYHSFIDQIVLTLHLDNWEWLCDCLFRRIMPVDFPEGVYQLGFERFRAIMPGLNKAFELALDNLLTRTRAYLDHYLSEAEGFPGDPRIMAKKRYKVAPQGDWEKKQELIEIHNSWDRKCTMLLFNLVHALNEFSEVVRQELRPSFFLKKGRFCVYDFMGLMGEPFVEKWHIPSGYFTEEEIIEKAKPPVQEGSSDGH